MRALLVCECRNGVLQDTWRELTTVAGLLKVDTALAIAYPPDIDDAALADCAADLAHISELLTKRYLT